MANKYDDTRRGSDTPAKVGAIINTVAGLLIGPVFGIVGGQLSDGLPMYLQVIVSILIVGVLFEAVMGWIIYLRWMKTSATWPYMWLRVMGFIPFGFITYLIAAKEWQISYRFHYQGGREKLDARIKAFKAKQAAEEEERKRKEAAFRATPEGRKLTEREDQIRYFSYAVKDLCENGHWDYGKNVSSNPATFDLTFRDVDLDEKAGTVFIYFESKINLYVTIDPDIVKESFDYRTRVELDCKSFCKGRATKFASRVRNEILAKYQKGSAGDYFSRFQKVESIIKFNVKK
ncbi:MAG: hypothetical protein J5627_00220 [Bacilli bacterium]|nr:hypothetical protein [Bacilli bacterium]